MLRLLMTKLIRRTVEWNKATCVKRDIQVKHRTHAVDDSRVDNGDRRVEISSYFTTGSFKI